MFKELWIWFVELLGKGLSGIKRLFGRMFGYLRMGVADIPRGIWLRVLIALPLIFILYILIGMALVHRVDDRMDLSYETPAGGSQAVAITAALVNRETRQHNWTVNDPFFQPGWWLDNGPNFQRGILGATSRFAIELRDHLGRTRGSSAEDPDLEKAAGNLTRELDRWVVDFSTSLLPTTASDTYFREAADNLVVYNNRLTTGGAIFDRRADNLLATLDRIALDLGASSATLDDYIRENAGGIGPDFTSDDVFYRIKGQVYAYAYIITGLQKDFGQIITDKDLDPMMDQLLASLTAAASLRPTIVMNGAIDGTMANHLSVLGFYLLRARTQLREVTSILLT